MTRLPALLADAAAAATNHPDPSVREQVALALTALDDLPRRLEALQAQLARESTPAACLQIPPAQIDLCLQQARGLCDADDFLGALPLALYCATYAPDHSEHGFLAGACLQRLGDAASAAHFYRVALQVNADDAACAYRLGECLEQLGQPEDAAHLYQWAIELARGNFALQMLQDLASQRLARL